MDGNGKRSSVPRRKAVIATRDERSIRVSDFSGPTGSIADHGRIGVITLPAPDVEPVERPPEILPLLGRRLYILALRSGSWEHDSRGGQYGLDEIPDHVF